MCRVGYVAGARSAPRTIIIIGPPRSGTSMVAGALHNMGVFLGRSAESPIFEDNRLDSAFVSEPGSEPESKRLLDAIAEYNASHQVWAYKRPTLAIKHIRLIHSCFRNPLYIFCFRDILSTANRNRISAGADLLTSMESALSGFGEMVRFLGEAHPDALLLSYEKALSDKDAFLVELMEFCGLETSAERVRMAADFVTPTPKGYVEYSERARDVHGYLDAVRIDSIIGWVQSDSGKQKDVVLLVDGKEVAKATADKYREDLVTEDPHAAGYCAFEFRDYDSRLIVPGAEVRVRTAVNGVDLINSPFRVIRREHSSIIGGIERVEVDSVSGWVECDSEGTELVLLVDGKESAREVVSRGASDVGRESFVFDSCPHGLIRPGTEVRVIRARDGIEFGNSPYVFLG